MDDPEGEMQEVPRHHAVIAGTGRAGTSFLVRFLEHCGLDTASADKPVNVRARAGLEHNLFDEDAPYVVKDPWLFAYCEQLDLRAIAIDVLMVPMRDLLAASTSRILQERIAMAEENPWSSLSASSEVHGAVEGGAVYSLDPVDQARILAVGFHRLLRWATARGIPLILLEFPRIVNDAEYLVDMLWPWLGDHCQRDHALAAFAAVAEPNHVRVEWSETTEAIETTDPEQLDRAALKVLLAERELALKAGQDDLAVVGLRLAEVQGQLAQTQGQLAETLDRLVEDQRQAKETERDLRARLAAAQDELQRESSRLAETEQALHRTTAEVAKLHQTWSWRLTRPLRSARARALGRPGSGDETSERAPLPGQPTAPEGPGASADVLTAGRQEREPAPAGSGEPSP